jgi:hypothetical protein|tara:strand:- start:278 stop:1129 length:852 start_codon:yes stop_codon:yes gene_type:complete
MEGPVINIITRASRINFFKLCYESIHNQTYGNVNHIVTYETPAMYDKLKHYKDITLVKVPHKAKIKGLVVSWNHNIKTDNYLNPDHEFLDYQVLNSGKDHSNNRFVNEHKPVDEDFYEWETGDIHTHGTGNQTWREYGTHAPYNWYLKIAEKALVPGWVMYVDDDDQLNGKSTLLKVVEEILDNDKDTLHIFRFAYPNGELIPDDMRKEMYRVGYPFVHKQLSGVNLCFPTKYSDYTYWDEWSSADYRTAKSLREIIPNLNISDLVAVKLTRGTNGGLLNDIK